MYQALIGDSGLIEKEKVGLQFCNQFRIVILHVITAREPLHPHRKPRQRQAQQEDDYQESP